jgi:hypothetical protein
VTLPDGTVVSTDDGPGPAPRWRSCPASSRCSGRPARSRPATPAPLNDGRRRPGGSEGGGGVTGEGRGGGCGAGGGGRGEGGGGGCGGRGRGSGGGRGRTPGGRLTRGPGFVGEQRVPISC